MTPAQRALDLVARRPPSLGSTRLICIEGPAGSGKTTLAAAIEALAVETLTDDVAVVHCDELLQGWRGLPGLAATVEGFLRPLASDRTGTWTRWAWDRDEWAESHHVEPGGLLVLEGVACWAPAYADLVGVLVWVEAPRGERLDRGLARDGEQMREHWLTWIDDEDALYARLDTRARADLVVDGGGQLGPDQPSQVADRGPGPGTV